MSRRPPVPAGTWPGDEASQPYVVAKASKFVARPTMVCIGPFDFKISEWSAQEAEQMKKVGMGMLDIEHLRIWLLPNLIRPHQAEVLLHEILHAIWVTGSIRMLKDEEEIVTNLSMNLQAAMVRNPEVFTWIMESKDA